MTESKLLTAEALLSWSDQELITEWSKTTWEEDDARMRILPSETYRRGLDLKMNDRRISGIAISPLNDRIWVL